MKSAPELRKLPARPEGLEPPTLGLEVRILVWRRSWLDMRIRPVFPGERPVLVLRCCPELTAGIREHGAQMGLGRLRMATTEREVMRPRSMPGLLAGRPCSHPRTWQTGRFRELIDPGRG